MNLRILNSSLLITLALMAGCGPMQTNPKSDFNEVDQTFVPAHDTKPSEQRFVPPGIISLKPVDETSLITDATVVFEEGKTNRLKFRVQVLDSNVNKIKVTPIELPPGATVTESSSNEIPNTYELTWTPKDFIDKRNNYSVTEVKLQVETQAENPESIRYLDAVNKIRVIKIIVLPSLRK